MTDKEIIQMPGLPAELGEKITLTRNSRGYNWEITLRDKDAIEKTLDRLKAIDKQLNAEYGGIGYESK